MIESKKTLLLITTLTILIKAFFFCLLATSTAGIQIGKHQLHTKKKAFMIQLQNTGNFLRIGYFFIFPLEVEVVGGVVTFTQDAES